MARITSLIVAIPVTLLAVTAAQGANYPVDGRWGVTASTQKGPVDCSRLRVIAFDGNQRTDSHGGVPTFRNQSIQQNGTNNFRIVDEFTTGQISNAQARYTLKIVEPDRVELNQRPGGLLKLRKCK